MTQELKKNELCILSVSGINYPTDHRKYLLSLVREVAIKHRAVCVLIAGNTVDGRALNKELKAHMQYEMDELQTHSNELTRKVRELVKLSKNLTKKAKNAEKRKNSKLAGKFLDQIKQAKTDASGFAKEADSFDKESFCEDYRTNFIKRHAHELNALFPKIPNVNYHIAIAEDVYDLPIGVEILEYFETLRDDIRLIGAQEDGSYDPEPKLPHQLKGFGEIRIILPRRQPWYYRILSSFMQRLINSFISRTQSPKPDLILVGCSGTAIYLPHYDGVPCISIPTLHKLNEQRSTENMVGCSVVRIVVEKDRNRIISGTYDFRPAIFNERRIAIPSNANNAEQAVLRAVIESPASPKTLFFRITEQDDRKTMEQITQRNIDDALRRLLNKKVLVYNTKSNQYAISEHRLQQTTVSLDWLFKNSTSLRQTVTSCFHCGCLKTLYHTNFNYLPENAENSDVLVENGDGIQGLAHNYEYNGELLPTMLAYDKQERYLAVIRARNILDVFKLRLKKFQNVPQKKKQGGKEIVQRCLIPFWFQTGNHPSWKHHQKHTLILGEFENNLKAKLIDGILAICNENRIVVSYDDVRTLVTQRVVRIGEHFMSHINGFTIGVKHPYKGRTLSKSHRVQDVMDFIWRQFFDFIENVLNKKNAKGFVLVDVANFHEAAAVHVAKFGRTALGLMTGAQLKDTRFESHVDKVVDYGTANVFVIKNEDDRLLFSEVEFDNRIHPDDEKIVFADNVMTKDVLGLCQTLDKEAQIPWRF